MTHFKAIFKTNANLFAALTHVKAPYKSLTMREEETVLKRNCKKILS